MRCGSWLVVSVGKVFPCAALFVILLTSSCQRSAGPVHKLTIDSAKVESILLNPRAPFVLEDRGLITRVVNEINGLSFSPYPLPSNASPRPDIVLKDKSGDTIVEVGSGGDCVVFWEPQSPWFCVKKDGLMETTGRLLGYAAYLRDMDSLKFHANEAVWDQTDQRMVALDWRGWVTKLYPEPYRSWPVPGTPEELSERLKSLPVLTLDDLERFPNYFD